MRRDGGVGLDPESGSGEGEGAEWIERWGKVGIVGVRVRSVDRGG